MAPEENSRRISVDGDLFTVDDLYSRYKEFIDVHRKELARILPQEVADFAIKNIVAIGAADFGQRFSSLPLQQQQQYAKSLKHNFSRQNTASSEKNTASSEAFQIIEKYIDSLKKMI